MDYSDTPGYVHEGTDEALCFPEEEDSPDAEPRTVREWLIEALAQPMHNYDENGRVIAPDLLRGEDLPDE